MNSQPSSAPTRIEPKMTTIAKLCDKHGEYQARQFSMGLGVSPMVSGCPHCAAEYAAESRKRELAEAERARVARTASLFAASGIPKRFDGKRIADYVATSQGQHRIRELAERYVAKFHDQPGASLVFCGKPGTGKTHIACGIAAALIEAGNHAVFTTVLAAIRTIKETYRSGSERSEADAIARLVSPALLILDEVGVQTGSDHEKMLLFEVINERYQACVATILISNLTRDELGAYLGDRMMDRFREGGAVVAFDWSSHRGGAV